MATHHWRRKVRHHFATRHCFHSPLSLEDRRGTRRFEGHHNHQSVLWWLSQYSRRRKVDRPLFLWPKVRLGRRRKEDDPSFSGGAESRRNPQPKGWKWPVIEQAMRNHGLGIDPPPDPVVFSYCGCHLTTVTHTCCMNIVAVVF
jgi:hypothetical protein